MESTLRMVAFHLTWVCDNRCEYCYVGDIDRTQQPSLQKVVETIKELAHQKVRELLLVGGDPCLYPRLVDVLETAKNYNFKLSLLSNTLSFPENDFGKMVTLIEDFSASILGHQSEEHDRIARRKGAYNHLVKGIRMLNDANMPVGIVLNATPKTYDKFYETIENLIEREYVNKINYVMVQRIVPCGRAKGMMNYMLTPSQVNILCKDIKRIEEAYGLRVVFEDPYPLCIVEDEYHRLFKPCEWGYTKGSVNYLGDVSRCGADTRYMLGNIFKTDLQTIWENSPILASFRSKNWLPRDCQNCYLLEKCGGGCSLSKITQQDHECDILCPNCRNRIYINEKNRM